ncbi:type II secretion system F family protein [soil metagenome]
MPETQQQQLNFIIQIAAFGLVIFVWMAGVVFWWSRRAKRTGAMHDRLKAIQSDGSITQGRTLRLWHEGKEATTIVPGDFRNTGFGSWLETLRVEAGWASPLSSMMLGLVGTTLMFAVAAYVITTSVLISIGVGISVLIVFWIYLTQRISRRTAHFERSLIDALELAARSLRAGHPLLGAFHLIAEEIPPPIGDLFGRVCQQQDLGVGMDEALRAIAEKHNSDDLKLFATSVVIQLRSGGNLADMMMRLANVIRERNKLTRRVRVLTSQTQFSKRVLLSLPFFVFVLLNVVNPVYMQPLYNTFAGTMIMVSAASGLLVGWLMMNWLSKIAP